jgi:hypothetical protein
MRAAAADSLDGLLFLVLSYEPMVRLGSERRMWSRARRRGTVRRGLL